MSKKFSTSEVTKLTGISRTKLLRISNPNRNKRNEREWSEDEVIDLINNQKPWERKNAIETLESEIDIRKNEISFFEKFLRLMLILIVLSGGGYLIFFMM